MGITVKDQDLFSVVYENNRAYAEDVISNRSFQSSTDGLKPVQRAYMWSLFRLSQGGTKKVKSQTVSADVIGNYHPHGDTSVYLTSVSMAEERASLIKALSVMSSRVNEQPTAARYTDVILSELGKELFSTIDLCPMEESFSGEKMPKYLLPRFPYQLMNYSINIGVGYGNTILPLNAAEVMEATILTAVARKNGSVPTTEELVDIILGPDLYAGHTVYTNRKSLISLVESGSGFCTVVSKIEYDSAKKEVVVRELPFREKAPHLFQSIADKVIRGNDKKNNYANKEKITGIKDDAWSNTSSDDDIKIKFKVDTSKGFDYQHVINELYNKTNLKKGYSIEYLLTTKEGKLDIFSVRELIEQCIEVNILYFTSKYENELAKLEARREENVALEKVTREENREKFGKLMYLSNKKELAIEQIGLTESESDLIFSRNVLNRFSKRAQILEELERFEAEKQLILVKMEMDNILAETIEYLKYVKTLVNIERRSIIVDSPISNITPKVRVIEKPKSVLISLTKNNIVHSTPNSEELSYRAYGDDIRTVMSLNEDDSVMAICDGNTVKIPVSEIGETPTPLALYGIRSNILTVIPMPNNPREDAVWFFVNNFGQVKVVKETELYSKPKYAKGSGTDDNMVVVDCFRVLTSEMDDVLLGSVTKNGFARFSSLDSFTPKNKLSGFIRFTKLDDNDEVVGNFVIKRGFGIAEVETLDSEGKVTKIDMDEDFFLKPVLNRGVRVLRDKEITSIYADLKVNNPTGMDERFVSGTGFGMIREFFKTTEV